MNLTLELDVPIDFICESVNLSILDGEYKGDISVFGKDGMGDLDLINPKAVVEEKNAVDFIIESVKKYPNEIEIVSLGPATNIALAINKDPETMKKANGMMQYERG